MSKEIPQEALALDRALEARVRVLVKKQLNEILTRVHSNAKHEARVSVRTADKKMFERMTEMVDMILDGVNNEHRP